MRWFTQLFTRRRRRYEELSETIREHLEEKIADLMDRGMTREQAESTARREFGNVTREVWQWPTLESLWADTKYVLRRLRRAPLFSALAGVCAGIELHNYRFWYGAPSLQELIASNGIHAGLVLSHMRPLPPNWNLKSELVAILVNGEVRASGRCAEIMGSPLRSIQWLANHAAERGQRLLAGELVIPGSAVELVRVEAGDWIEARFATLGSCHGRLI
jgi:hypothetical protein